MDKELCSTTDFSEPDFSYCVFDTSSKSLGLYFANNPLLVEATYQATAGPLKAEYHVESLQYSWPGDHQFQDHQQHPDSLP